MSTIQTNGIELYYEEHGSGEPLLLIMGWGGNASTWKPQIRGLAERYRVIAFDNRGVGRSSAPDGPYRIEELAADATGLLDHLGLARAHVFGVSMGGMVAQEVALRHPERVSTLVLGCSTAGGSRSPGHDALREQIESFRDMANGGGPDLEAFTEFLRHLWTEEALAKSESSLQDFVLSLIRVPPTDEGLRGQADAICAFDAYERLPGLAARTLVITGAEDTLIDPRSSVVLAQRIAGAELRFFPGLKHAFHLERPDLVNPIIIDFIERARDATSEPSRNGF